MQESKSYPKHAGAGSPQVGREPLPAAKEVLNAAASFLPKASSLPPPSGTCPAVLGLAERAAALPSLLVAAAAGEFIALPVTCGG